jgi:hypothetical protein
MPVDKKERQNSSVFEKDCTYTVLYASLWWYRGEKVDVRKVRKLEK